MTAAWLVLALGARADYPHAGDDLGSVGAAFATMFDVVGMLIGFPGSAFALAGTVTWLCRRRTAGTVLLVASAATPLVVVAGFILWMFLTPV